MAQGVHKITEQFEEELCKYTGAPYAIALDNCSNAIFLALMFVGVKGRKLRIPSCTYPSVPCEIIHAGAKPVFVDEGPIRTGMYEIGDTKVFDSALCFTRDMYVPSTYQCLSFTGPFKHLKLGKGGAILTSNPFAAKWFKRVRFSGRNEVSYFEDSFDMLGWNFYMMPEIAARGLLLIQQFYKHGVATHNEDLSLAYPDLSDSEAYKNEE